MTGLDLHAQARAAVLDLVRLRRPIDEAEDDFALYTLGDYRGAPLAVFDQAALRGADAAVARFQKYAPLALLCIAVIGAAYALGGIG
jgi:hypothetical protein